MAVQARTPMKTRTQPPPRIAAMPFLSAAPAEVSAQEREQLLSIASEFRLPRNARVFERGQPAAAVFSVIEGVARSWRPMPGASRHVVAFLLQGDLFGLARLGRYVNTVEAVTPLKLYRFPLEPLTAMLRGNPELQFKVLCRVTQNLRESQRRAAIAARRDLNGRIAMLLLMMEESQSIGAKRRPRILVPLTAADVAEFVSATEAGVRRSMRELEALKILRRDGRNTIRILDRDRFESLAGR